MEKETFIQNIWTDKKGKSDGPAPFGLYIALDSPRPNLEHLTNSVLRVLSENTNDAHLWARTWGRVVICVAPGGKPQCNLNYIDDPESKRYVPVQTTQILDTSEVARLISPITKGSLATIVLNNQPTTIEAFLISYIHMVDELIWEIFRARKTRYSEVVKKVMSDRFSICLGTEDQILSTKMSNPTVSVRLYGSGVNKNVPKVMGGIIFEEVL